MGDIIAITSPNYLFYIFVTFDFSVLFLTKVFHQVFAEEMQGRGHPALFGEGKECVPGGDMP